MDLDFSDLVPQAAPASVSFDDLVPAAQPTGQLAMMEQRRAGTRVVPNPFGPTGPGTGAVDADALPLGQSVSFDDLVPAAPASAAPLDPGTQRQVDAYQRAYAGRMTPTPAPSTTYRGDDSTYLPGVAVRTTRGDDAPYAPTGETRVPGQGLFGATAASLARGAITGTTDTAAGAVRMLGRAVDTYQDPEMAAGMAMSGQTPEPRTAAQALTDPMATRISKAGTDAADSAVPVDSKYANSTWVKTSGLIGGALPYLAAAAVSGPAGGISAAAAGAAGTYESIFQDATAHGATPDKAHEAALLPALIGGGLMSVNAGVILKGLPFGTQQALLRPIVDLAAASGTMVGVSEAQKLVNNFNAQKTYDPKRSLTEGVGDDLLAEALSGGLLHAGVHARGAVSGAMDRLTQPVAAPEFRQGVAGMTEAATGANERTANTAAPAPEDAPANVGSPDAPPPAPPPPEVGGQFSNDQRAALGKLGYSADDIAAMPPDAAGRVIEQGLGVPQPIAEPAAERGADRMAPITGTTFQQRAGGVVSRLQADLGLTRDQAAGIVGNLGHESEGLTAGIQERNPTSGRGGLGWAQWTGPRRVEFERYAAERGLATTDPEANYGFLVHELRGSESKALTALRGTDGLDSATRVFQGAFERAGVVAMSNRLRFAREASSAMPETAAAARGDGARVPEPDAAPDQGPQPDPAGEALAGQVAQSLEGTQPVYTNSGTRIDVRPEVVDLASLTASHDQDGRVNPDFPHAEGVQPRDRSSAASQAQIQGIASGLVPDRLGISRDAGNGAPIVSPDGIVESGNGRTLALGRVYGDPRLADQAASYKEFLRGQGYDISGMDQPVLVGRRVTQLDDAARATFARDANERSTLAMSQAEQARADAPRATGIMGMWSGDDPASAGNRDFVRAFMARITPEEAGAMRLPDGSLSPEGARRIQSAVTAGAYGDVMGATLDRALNGNSDGMRAVAGAMSDAAGPWAAMRQAAAEGRIPPGLDVTKGLAEAVDTLTRARQLNRPVRELVGQADLDRPPLSPEGQAVLGMMFNNAAMTQPAGRARVADRLRAYAEEAAKAAPAPDMFGTPPPTAMDVAAAAMRRGAQAAPQAAMLARRDATQAHAATGRDPDASTLTPDALAARDRLRTGAQAMMRFAGLPSDAGLKLVDRLMSGGADASYSRGLITMALDTHPDAMPAKMFHETIHGLMDPAMGVLTDGQRATLLAGADRYLAKNPEMRAHIESLYGTDRATVREEAVARMGEDAMRAGLMRQTPGAVVYGKLLNAVRGLGSMLRGQGYRTADGVFNSVLRGDRAAPGSREALAATGPRDPVRAAAAAYGAPLSADTRRDGANENGAGAPSIEPAARPNETADVIARNRTAAPSDLPLDPLAAAIARDGKAPDRYFSLRDDAAWKPGLQTEVQGAASIEYQIAKDGRTADIHMLRVPTDARKEGQARRAMEVLTQEADQRGVTLRLTSDPMDRQTSKAKLDAFYRSLGFEKNAGRKRDFTTRAEFIRKPDDTQYSRRAPLLSDKAALEREGQSSMFGRSAREAQQARDDAGGLRSGKDQKAADDLPLFERTMRDNPELFSLRAFHGSPHEFDRFDVSKIGTGEGAQAYGHGLYFAENEKIAKHYRDTLADVRYEQGGKPIDMEAMHASPLKDALGWLGQASGDYNKAREQIKDASLLTQDPRLQQEHAASLAALNRAEDAGYVAKPFGRMFEVALHAEPHELLDWDKPLSEQSPQVQDALKNAGFDAALKREGYSNGLADFQNRTGQQLYERLGIAAARDTDGRIGSTPNQNAASDALAKIGIPGIRYADGNSRGTEGGTSNYVMFHHDPVEVIRKYSLRDNLTSAVRDSSTAARNMLGKALDEAFFPMRLGSDRAQVAAFKFTNALRGIQYRYSAIDRQLTKGFTADERSAMGRALDAQSVFEQGLRDADPATHEAARAAFDAGRTGLTGLNDKQRDVVGVLDGLARDAWKRMADLKLVMPDSTGLPNYMPRQFVMMDGLTGARRITREDNQIVAAGGKSEGGAGGGGGGGGMSAMHPQGGNLNDSGVKKRGYLTPEESAAAAKIKFGDGATLVTDIRSLVDAISRQERSIAGRQLIDMIKRVGKEGGVDLVREGVKPERDFYTLDHPSMQTVGPTGEVEPDGKPIYGRMPLHIAAEFKGPLDAVLSKPAPAIYNGILAVKNAGVGAIMISPYIHLMVEVGRSLPVFNVNPLALGKAMTRGKTMKEDRGLMDRAISEGLAPIGAGWTKYDAVSVVNDALKTSEDSTFMRRMVNGDTAAQKWWHNFHQSQLWDKVANLQNGIYGDMQAKYQDAGWSPRGAGMMAAHLANRYAGALPPEQLSRFANMSANMLMFSRSFTLGNLGVMKDMFNGAPSHIKAMIADELGPVERRSFMQNLGEFGKDATNFYRTGDLTKDTNGAIRALRRKAIGAFALDIALFHGMVAVVQSMASVGSNSLSMGLPAAARQEWDDYISHFHDAMLPQSRNEPTKEGRSYIGKDAKGIGTYVRTPTGKVGEEFLGWLPILGHPGTMLLNKAAPLLRATYENVTGKDSLDRNIYNPNPHGIAEQIGKARDIAFHFLKAMGPTDLIASTYNLGSNLAGYGPPVGDKLVAAARILGPITGLGSISQGNHNGPEAGAQQELAGRVAYAKQQAVPEARKLIEAGKPDEARTLMENTLRRIGVQDYQRDAQAALKPMLNPARVQVRRDAAFERRADDEQRQRAASVTGGRGGPLGIAAFAP